MSVYHHHLQTKSRGKGASAIAAAAYRSRSKLYDEQEKKWHDYSRKEQELALSVLIGERAGKLNRGEYWNRVEKVESRKNNQLAHEIVIALPSEVTDQDRAEIAIKYGEWLNKRYNVIVDLNIHKPQEGEKNYHAHLMFSTRQSWIDLEGNLQLAKKKDGTIRNLADLKKSSEEIEILRATWEEIVNAKLQEKGLPAVSRKSVKDRLEPRLAKPWFPRWLIEWEKRTGQKHPRRSEWEVKNNEFQELIASNLSRLTKQAKAKEEAEAHPNLEPITPELKPDSSTRENQPTASSPEIAITPENQPAPISPKPKPKPKPQKRRGIEFD